MKILILLPLIFTIISCVTNPPIENAATNYSNVNKPLLDSGQLGWSDYYIGLYDAIASQPTYTTGDELKLINSLIDTAKDYEQNKISQDVFESKRRETRAALAKIQSDYQLKIHEIDASRQRNSEPYTYIPTYRKSTTTNCNTYGNNTTCTTR